MQLRDPLDVAAYGLKLTGRLLILQSGVRNREVVDLLELLVQSHCSEQGVRAFTGARGGVHPSRRLGGSRWVGGMIIGAWR